MAKKESFVLYTEYSETFDALSVEEAGRLIRAIFRYVCDSTEPVDLEPATLMAFRFIRKQLDRDIAKWETTRKNRVESGRAGGFAKAANARQAQANVANASFARNDIANASNAKQTLANVAVYGDGDVDGDVNGDVDVNGYGDGDVNGAHSYTASVAMELSLPPSLIYKANQWIDYKARQGEPKKDTEIKSLLKQIKKNADQYGQNAVVDLINLSMAQGWKGIYFDRLSQNQGRSVGNGQDGYDASGRCHEAERYGTHL